MNAYTLVPALSGSICQSLTHPEDELVPATTEAAATLAPHIVATVHLCDLCASALMIATAAADSADG